ncbi:MAG: sel1 repeat family protein [Methylobacillus sp.]|nr:sel1 repeat family protein [Methylobacillus sp.]
MAQAQDSGNAQERSMPPGEQYSTARSYHRVGNYEKAAIWYRKAAEQGRSDAQYYLAEFYRTGTGVPQDYKQALFWYRKSAEQKDDKQNDYESGLALATLGYLYTNVESVRDYKEAAYWYRKAADWGDPSAMSGLGMLYYNGQGVPQNYEEAAFWFRKANDGGPLGHIYEYGQGVPQDDNLAAYWYRKAAEGPNPYWNRGESGNAQAQNNLGNLYYEGRGVPVQDYEEAAFWYRKAAEQGEPNALLNLSDMYVAKRVGFSDDVLAYMLLSLAAAKGKDVQKSLRVLESTLSAAQLKEARALAQQWQPGTPLPLMSKTGGSATLWTMLEVLARQIPITKEKIESSLSITLNKQVDPDDSAKRLFVSDKLALRDGVKLAQIELESRSSQLTLDIEGACISEVEVRHYFSIQELNASTHPPSNWFGGKLKSQRAFSTSDYRNKQQITWFFGFIKQGGSDCLAQVAIRP